MINNQEILEELKNGNTARINFFKEKIKEELKKQNINFDEKLITDILNNAINSYNDSIKIPFLFHLKTTIKNENKKPNNINTGILNNEEYHIIKLYLSEEDNKYLSKGEIAKKLGLNLNDILKAIEKIDTNKDEIEKLFPNYKNKLKDRTIFFTKKTASLTEDQILLIVDYCGVFEKPLNIVELAKKWGKSTKTIYKELLAAFKLLKIERNLYLILKKFPNIKSTLFERSKELKIILDDEKESTNIIHVINTDFTRKSYLNNDDIIILKLLDRYQKKELTEQLIKEAGLKNIEEFIEKRIHLFTKIKASKNLIKEINLSFKELNIEELMAKPRLTSTEFKALSLLDKKRELPDTEKIKNSEFNSFASFRLAKNRALKKLNESNYLLDRVLLLLPELDLNYKDSNLNLTPNEINILKVLNEHNNLNNKELANITGYDNITSFIIEKQSVLAKLKNDKEIYLKVIKLFPNIKLESKKGKSKTELSDKNKELLILLKESQDKDLSSEEIAHKLNYISTESYINTKIALFKKLKNNETLKREALKIYPELILDKKIEGMTLTFTNMEINFLQEFCLVKNNNLIYQSIENIAKNLKLSKETTEVARASSTSKVIKNVIIGNNLDILLWPNFLNEFITRDNFSLKNSIDINEDELIDLEKSSTKKDLITGIDLLEKSIFKDYISTCDTKIKAIIALKLGYFNKRFFTDDEIATIFDVDKTFIIEITKDCLSKSVNNFIEEKQKIKK